MQTWPVPVRAGFAALFALAGLFLTAGCATSPGGTGQVRGPARIEPKLYFVVEAPGGGAAIYINGDMRGVTPMHLRLDADEFGRLLEDVELVAEWADGRSNTTFRIPAGSRPPAVVRLNPNGLLGF